MPGRRVQMSWHRVRMLGSWQAMAPCLDKGREKGRRAPRSRMVEARRPAVDRRHNSRQDMWCCHDQARNTLTNDLQKCGAVR